MKNITFFILIIIITFSCVNNNTSEDQRNITLNDTITTSSGLKYIILEDGNGRKIEVGCKVRSYTDLYINDADTIFWTTASEKDSVFQFIHGKTPLIKGFSELNNYLSEGDVVIAILPDSLAYGKKGRGDMPGGATLIYDPYIVKYVSEPKEVLTDTLYAIIASKDLSEAINFYKKVLSSALKKKYHTELEDMMDLLGKLNKDSLYSESEFLADYFLAKTEDVYTKEGFYYYKVMALEGQGKLEEAINLVESILKQEESQQWWDSILNNLKENQANQ